MLQGPDPLFIKGGVEQPHLASTTQIEMFMICGLDKACFMPCPE